jgi:hypothetical protein
MTPWQLAKDSELSHQSALFCFCNKAIKVGFKLAKDERFYLRGGETMSNTIPELAYYHAIPNGVRTGDAIARIKEGGALKGAGVKAGVLDTFWPLKRGPYCGLYIEMKKPSLKSTKNPYNGCSDEQNEFGQFVSNQMYVAKVCYSWLEAAEVLEWYYNLKG